MRLRSSIALVATTALFIAACSLRQHRSRQRPLRLQRRLRRPPHRCGHRAPHRAVAPATATAPPASQSAPPPSGSPAAGAWTVGVVTDVGTVNDKNFNEFSFQGAKLGATAIGAGLPDVASTR